jgi:hypothetical protein
MPPEELFKSALSMEYLSMHNQWSLESKDLGFKASGVSFYTLYGIEMVHHCSVLSNGKSADRIRKWGGLCVNL